MLVNLTQGPLGTRLLAGSHGWLTQFGKPLARGPGNQSTRVFDDVQASALVFDGALRHLQPVTKASDAFPLPPTHDIHASSSIPWPLFGRWGVLAYTLVSGDLPASELNSLEHGFTSNLPVVDLPAPIAK